MKYIPLTQGKFAIVDDDMYEYLNQWKWCLRKKSERSFYAGRNDWENKKNHIVTMQQLIMNPPKGMVIDHINGNGLDNRRCNLRICTREQNLKNQKRHKNNKCGYKGVHWVPLLKKWRAGIYSDGKDIYIGVYASLEDAAKAYNKAAIKYHGEFARLNNV